MTVPVPLRQAEIWWIALILGLSAAVILVTVWCLAHGISTIFMHLYYFPIVLLAYHYRWKGFGLAMLLALAYLGLVWGFSYGQPDVIIGAFYRFLVFAGIAAVIAFIADRLVAAQSDLRKMQQFQSSMIENASVWIAALAPDGTVLVWNNAAEAISGYKKNGVLGSRTIWQQLYPDNEYRKSVTGKIRRIIARDTLLEDFETTIRCADGTTKAIVWNTRGLRDDTGAVTGYIAIGRDISAQKTAEFRAAESSRFLGTMIDAFPMPIFFKSVDGKYLGCNPLFEEYIGIRREALVGKTAFDISPRDLAERYTVADREVFDNPVSQRYETQVRYADGSRHDVIFYKAPFFSSDGAVGGLIGAFIDITGRKKTETALRQGDEKIRLLLNSAAEAIYGIDLAGNCTFCNSACLRMLGYRHEDELLGKNMHAQIHAKHADGSDYPVEECRIFQAFRKGEGTHVDDEVLWRSDGTSFPAEYWSYPQRSKGDVVGAVVTFLDITERRRSEEALTKSRATLDAALASMTDAVFIIGTDNQVVSFNDAFVTFHRFKNREECRRMLEGYPANLDVSADGEPVPFEMLAVPRALRGETATNVEFTLRRKDTGETWVGSYSFGPIRNKDGVITGAVVSSRDISEKKATDDRIRDLLRVQEEQLRIINTSPAISFLWRAEENWPVETVSANIAQFGYTPEDFITGRILFSSIIHPDDLDRVAEEVAYNSSHHIDDYTQEYRIFGKDRGLYWVTDYTHIRRNTVGAITHYEGIILDITERKGAEDALHETNAYLHNLIDYANAPIIVWDPELRITRFNHAFERLTGRTEQEVLGQHLSLLFPEENRESSLEQIKMTRAGVRWEAVEIPILHVSGEIRTVLWNSATIYSNDGDTVIATIAQGQDISLRKRAEYALRESEERNSAMVAAIPDLLFVFSRDGTYLDFQAADENLLAIAPEQILGKNVVDAGFDADTAKAILEAISTALETGALQQFEYKLAVPAGISWFEVRFVRLAVDRVLGVVRNITDIKSAEEALRNSRQLFMDIISFLPDPTFVIDKDGVVLAWNRALEQLSGVPAADIIGKGEFEYSLWLFGKRRPLLIDMILDPDKDTARQNYLYITWDGRTVTAETEYLPPRGGKKIPLLLVASPLLDAQGNIAGAIESLRDISRIKEAEAELERFNANLEKLIQERTQALNDEIVQRKAAEQDVQDALSYTRSVIEANPDLMVVLDRAGRILDVNAAAESLTGISREQMIGTSYSLYLMDNTTPHDILDQLLEKGRVGYTVNLRRADGHITPLSVNSTLFPGKEGTADARIIVAAHDITRQKEDEAALQAAFDEQVLLLREIHHRVKNNLQIIISLTNLQMRQTDDPRVRQVMSETQNRVRAMSLVHEKLYRSVSLSHIDFADYSRFLATQLFSYFGTDTRRVHLEFAMGKIMVDIVTAVPLGLLMNELVSNALKHAFPGEREGTICISGEDSGDHITLVVRDDGIGIPADYDWQNTTSLGMRLVTSLVDQVDGTIALDRENGTRFTITVRRSHGTGGPA